MICRTYIMAFICVIVREAGSTIVLRTQFVRARYISLGGRGVALLKAQVNPDMIRIIGRWRSNKCSTTFIQRQKILWTFLPFVCFNTETVRSSRQHKPLYSAKWRIKMTTITPSRGFLGSSARLVLTQRVKNRIYNHS